MSLTAQISLHGPTKPTGDRETLMDAYEVTGTWPAIVQTFADLADGFDLPAGTSIAVEIVATHEVSQA